MDELLSLLSTTEYLSGEKLCQQLGMTRAAVWKRIEKMREEGYRIQAAGKRGYRLEPVEGSLLPAYIAKRLSTQWVGQGTLLYEHTVTSTNTLLKELARADAPRGSLALCEMQKGGKGRLGRTWDAAEGENLLHSLLLRPSLPVEQAQLCTLAAAIAMAGAIEDTVPSLQAGIKWPNDIVIGGRKCVGILSELAADMDSIHYIVMGVGVNVNQRTFSGELQEKATSLLLERRAQEGKDGPAVETLIDRCALLTAYLSRMEQIMDPLEREGLSALMPEYIRRSVTLGARVRVIGMGMEFAGMAEAVDEAGALLVRDGAGELHRVLSGDVSVRGVMGYVEA